MECLFDKLGDDLIIHILCFLPTKYAVLTSVLSRRWQFLWCYANKSLEFDDRQSFREYPLSCKLRGDHFLPFYNFIERVLQLNKVPRIDKFSLAVGHGMPPLKLDCLVSCIEEIIKTRKAKEVEIYFRPCSCRDLLPLRLFQSTTLRVLKLHIITPSSLMGFTNNTSFSLPNLNILHFWLGCLYDRWRLFMYLFRASPLLEEANVGGFIGNNKKVFVNIYAPSLKKLRMKFISFDSLDKFYIKAPVLEELIVVDDLYHRYVVKSNSLVNAKLDIGSWELARESNSLVNRPHKLLCNISNVNFLNLKAHTMDALSKIYYLNNAKLPQFLALCQLKLCFLNYSSWNALSTLLECAPNLQVLVLSKLFSISDSEFRKDSTWNRPNKVPVCLLSRLLQVEVRDVESHQVEFDLLSYMLNHGEVLKDFLVELLPANSREDNLRFKDELLMVPRVSRTCQLIISAYPQSSPHRSSLPEDVEERNCRVTEQQLNIPPQKLCYEDLRLCTDYFSDENLITRTKGFKVYRGKFHQIGPYVSTYKDVVVKKWVITADSPYNKHKEYSICHFHEELKLLKHPNFKSHPYFMSLLGYCEEDSSERLGVVYEFKPLDNLENLIPKDSFSWLQRIKVALVMACSLEYLHREHGDLPSLSPRICPNCVILDENYMPGLFNFNIEPDGFRKCKEDEDEDDDETDFEMSWKDHDVYDYGITLLGLISKRAHQCPLISKRDDECPVSKRHPAHCVTLEEWTFLQQYERELGSRLCKSQVPLVHKELMEDSTYDFVDGLKLTRLAMRCMGEDGDMPSMHAVINSLCKLNVMRKNWDVINDSNVISKYLNVDIS